MYITAVWVEGAGIARGWNSVSEATSVGFVLVFLNREPMAKIDEGVAAPVSGGAARFRFISMKRTVSQQSFDGVSLDSSGPDDRISVDSDGSDNFVMLLESGKRKQSQPKF